MKEKTKYYIKLLLGLLPLSFIWIACNFKNSPEKAKEEQSKTVEIPANYSIVVIDSCEYIENKSNSFVLVHKANCRFCLERVKK